MSGSILLTGLLLQTMNIKDGIWWFPDISYCKQKSHFGKEIIRRRLQQFLEKWAGPLLWLSIREMLLISSICVREVTGVITVSNMTPRCRCWQQPNLLLCMIINIINRIRYWIISTVAEAIWCVLPCQDQNVLKILLSIRLLMQRQLKHLMHVSELFRKSKRMWNMRYANTVALERADILLLMTIHI